MHTVRTLLMPRLRSAINKGRETRGWIKLFLFAAAGGVLWLGIFTVCRRVLSYIRGIVDIGDLLALKLLSMAFVVFFSLLIFSSLLASLSKLYLSKDLTLVHALPVRSDRIYLARWIESTFDSSWMVLVYGIPVLVSFGIVFHAGWFFYLQMGLALAPLCIIASAAGAQMVMTVVMMLPAGRIRSILVFLGLLLFVVLYVAFRLLKPERLVDPEAFSSILHYLQNLSAPSSPFLPSTWIFDSMKAALENRIRSSFFHLSILWSGSAFLVFINLITARALYFKGFSKSRTAAFKLLEYQAEWPYRLFSRLSGPTRAFLIKEIKTFWRDQAQWSQLFLISALIVIYLYNFSVLPLEKSPVRTIYLQNILSFLNMALVAFVLIAVAVRFAFTSVSIEGSAFWIVKSYPISIRSFLMIKFMIYLAPLLLLTELLTIATNLLLQASPRMMLLSGLTILGITPGIVALGIGLGSAFPDFSTENPAQIITSFGGVLFMLISTGFIAVILMLEAGSVYIWFMAEIESTPIAVPQLFRIWGSFLIVGMLCVSAVILPLKIGENRLKIKFPEEPPLCNP